MVEGHFRRKNFLSKIIFVENFKYFRLKFFRLKGFSTKTIFDEKFLWQIFFKFSSYLLQLTIQDDSSQVKLAIGDEGDEVNAEKKSKSVYDSKIRMDDVTKVIKAKYAKEAAMQEEAMINQQSILDDPMIKSIRENKVHSAALLMFALRIFYL